MSPSFAPRGFRRKSGFPESLLFKLIGNCFLARRSSGIIGYGPGSFEATLRFLSSESIPISIRRLETLPSRLSLRNILPQWLKVGVFHGHETNVLFARQVDGLPQQLERVFHLPKLTGVVSKRLSTLPPMISGRSGTRGDCLFSVRA